MKNVRLEARLRSAAASYERLAPTVPDLERRIYARIAVTQREDRQPRGRQSLPIQLLAAAALIAFAIALAFLVRESRLFKEQQPVVTPRTSPQSLSVSGPGGWKYSAYAGRNYGPMATPRIGWEFVTRVTRTTDGGAHWTDITPSGLGNNFWGNYLDGDHAWIIQDLGNHVVALRTADGGKTWERGEAVPGSTTDAYGIGFAEVEFVDQWHGWLLLLHGPNEARLFRSGDGGLHWQLVSVNSAAATSGTSQFGCDQSCLMAFASPTTGWITSIAPQARPSLLATHDGGVTWRLQLLPLERTMGCPCYVDRPVFSDPAHGILMLWSTPNSLVGHLLVTSDGGRSWVPRALPGEAQILNVGFYDGTHGWAIAGPITLFNQLQQPSGLVPRADVSLPLFRTADGGATWVPVATALLLQSKEGSITDLQFLDSRDGFAIRSLVGPGQGFQGWQLLRTTDGGHTWSVVFTQH